MIMDLAAEAALAVLLVVTIGYCFTLNRRLSSLRAEQESLGDLITGLNQAAERAEDGVRQLRTVSQTTEQTLKGEISHARALADELALITEAGGNLADRIEDGLTRARAQTAHSTKIQSFPVEEAQGDDDIRQALRAAR